LENLSKEMLSMDSSAVKNKDGLPWQNFESKVVLPTLLRPYTTTN